VVDLEQQLSAKATRFGESFVNVKSRFLTSSAELRRCLENLKHIKLDPSLKQQGSEEFNTLFDFVDSDSVNNVLDSATQVRAIARAIARIQPH
jgi:hypothetical protein